MTPYSRFDTVASVVAALITLGSLLATALLVDLGLDTDVREIGGTLILAVVVMIVMWLALQRSIIPFVLRAPLFRSGVLGRYNFEGTWIQIERGNDFERMAIVDFQPNGNTFILSGYSVDDAMRVTAQLQVTSTEISWPFLQYQFRNPLSDGEDGLREGLGEIRFEMNRSAAVRYNGYIQPVGSGDRIQIEAVKLTKARDQRAIRTLAGRRRLLQVYREKFSPESMLPAHAQLEKVANELQAIQFRRKPGTATASN